LPRRFAGQLVGWGDPAQRFVGNPDGRIERYTGYGVYYQPVALAALGAGADVLQAGSGLYGSPVPPAAVYSAVLEGRVALAHYVAYDGADVGYTLTEHPVTVIGVRPDAELINDPWFGQSTRRRSSSRLTAPSRTWRWWSGPSAYPPSGSNRGRIRAAPRSARTEPGSACRSSSRSRRA